MTNPTDTNIFIGPDTDARYTHTWTLTSACTDAHMQTHMHKHMPTHTRAHVITHSPTYGLAHIHTHINTHTHLPTRIYTHTHTHTHTHTSTHTNVQNRGNYIRESACVRVTHPHTHMRIWPSPLPITLQTQLAQTKRLTHSPPTVAMVDCFPCCFHWFLLFLCYQLWSADCFPWCFHWFLRAS